MWELFKRLRRRGFLLGIDDHLELQKALRAGFGLTSRQALRELCVALWAKSHRDEEILVALFDQAVPADVDWTLPSDLSNGAVPDKQHVDKDKDSPYDVQMGHNEANELEFGLAHAQPQHGLPPISLEGVQVTDRSFVFVPQFPLTYREVAQACRGLRRPVRQGPSVELDVEATVAQHSRLGVISPVILRPRRQNLARLLLFVDRQGSMSPFHRFSDEVCEAILQSSRLTEVAVYYFHDVVANVHEDVLDAVRGQLFPVLDTILPDIEPSLDGYVYEDPELLSAQPLKVVLNKYAVDASVLVLSDAGAARRRYDVTRLLDAIAFAKALRKYTSRYVWLNPLPPRYWMQSTASQLKRHVPMFTLDRDGLYRAVNVLRGQPARLDRPI